MLVLLQRTEEYGIDILKVQEIRGYDAVTRIANSPVFLKSVINLRGAAIVPIVDLRIRFGLGNIRYDEFTVVIILNAWLIVLLVLLSMECQMSLTLSQIRFVLPLTLVSLFKQIIC